MKNRVPVFAKPGVKMHESDTRKYYRCTKGHKDLRKKLTEHEAVSMREDGWTVVDEAEFAPQLVDDHEERLAKSQQSGQGDGCHGRRRTSDLITTYKNSGRRKAAPASLDTFAVIRKRKADGSVTQIRVPRENIAYAKEA